MMESVDSSQSAHSDTPKGQRERIAAPLLAVDSTPMLAGEVVDRMAENPGRPILWLNHNLRSCFYFHTDDVFRRLYSRADFIVIDGWPIAASTPSLGPLPRRMSFRTRTTDWIEELYRPGRSLQPGRIFILGADRESNVNAQRKLARAMPDSVVAGRDGYFSLEEEGSVLADLTEFQPDLVILGLGMPLQEYFLLRNFESLPWAHYATVGGAIDYVSGKQVLSPKVVGKLGLEWLWRIIFSPRQFPPGRLVQPVRLAALLSRRHILRAVRRPIE